VHMLPARAASRPRPIELRVLSGRADLVSGGSALIQVVLPPGARGLRVSSSAADVTRNFGKGPDGKLEGLVDGLQLGTNVVKAKAMGARGAQLVLTDHPIGGPVLSGPQIQPWACQKGATDPQCNARPIFAYSYLPVGTGGLGIAASGIASANTLQPYDPAKPPPSALIATATTDTGATVPFIVRTETGYLDRDQYAVATLYQPDKPWSPQRPQPQFNRKLVLTHGPSCDTTYGTGTAPSVQDTKL